jgi:phosphoglycerate dehydrogenase-like enzyme
MNCVIVASKSFGYGADKAQISDLFNKYGLEPVFAPLKKAGGDLARAHGIIVGTEKITCSTFDGAPKLKAVVKYGVGIDNIDIRAAREHGVQVLNLPGINSITVAEMALGLMLAVSRRIAAGDRSVRAGKWEGLIGTDVVGKNLGIVGTGAVGCALAKMVSGLGMTVLGYDPVENQDFSSAGGRYVVLDCLLDSSDFISLHLPLNDTTVHFIDGKKLAQMKKGAILINTSRGRLVDESALLVALSNGRLAGASLDVFEQEPPARKELLSLENAVFTPHIAAYTEETLRRMDHACLATLKSALQDRGKEGREK